MNPWPPSLYFCLLKPQFSASLTDQWLFISTQGCSDFFFSTETYIQTITWTGVPLSRPPLLCLINTCVGGIALIFSLKVDVILLEISESGNCSQETSAPNCQHVCGSFWNTLRTTHWTHVSANLYSRNCYALHVQLNITQHRPRKKHTGHCTRYL